MALPAQKHLFGIHSFTALDRLTGLPYGAGNPTDRGILKVLGGSTLTSTSELIDLRGGSNPYPVATERGMATTEFTLNLKEYPDWMMVLAGAQSVVNAAEASGSVSGLADLIGTSVVSATTGIASIAVTTAADVKAGHYRIVAVSATTVDVYAATDRSFYRGTDLAYQNGALKITASALTVPGTGGTVAIPGTGLTITGGSGTVAFTTSDVAEFDVREPNTGSSRLYMPSNPVPIEFEGFAYGQLMSNGNMFEIHAPRCILGDAPCGMTENEFSTTDITIRVLFDDTRGYTFARTYITR